MYTKLNDTGLEGLDRNILVFENEKHPSIPNAVVPIKVRATIVGLGIQVQMGGGGAATSTSVIAMSDRGRLHNILMDEVDYGELL